MVIGYYANARSARPRGEWRRILPNGLARRRRHRARRWPRSCSRTKALFFFADTGYPDFNRVDQDGMIRGPRCQTGADCVYRRYLARRARGARRGGRHRRRLVRDPLLGPAVGSARLLVAGTTGAALLGAFLFGIAGPRATVPAPARKAPAPA